MALARRRFLQTAGAAVAAPALPRAAAAVDYPTRSVRVIVPFAAGGSTDIAGRLISQWLSERLGQQFVIENRPGGGTNTGTEVVVRAPPDGYTLLICGATNAINATLYEKLTFNFIADIAPVASVVRLAARLGSECGVSGQIGRGTHRLCQGQSRQDQHGVERHRGYAAYGRRVVQTDGRYRYGPCTLPRRCAGNCRPARRPGAGLFRRRGGGDRIHPGRQVAGVGGRHRNTIGRACRIFRP